ncbi:hypothetical protein AAHE18_03G229400 [Arachis hypogaea]
MFSFLSCFTFLGFWVFHDLVQLCSVPIAMGSMLETMIQAMELPS